MNRNGIIVTLFVLMIIAAGYGVMQRSAESTYPTTPRATKKEIDPSAAALIEQTVNDAQTSSPRVITRLDTAAHRVQVNSLIWTIWDADAKKAFTEALAIYCDLHTDKSGLYFVDVIDSQSAKKIAHYGPTGFEVF